VTATRAALKLGEYVVTEAGFGADLGAEKFIDIKCRKSGLQPDAAVVVATLRALKHHGGVGAKELNVPNLQALSKGIANLERHVHNVRHVYGLPCVVSVNHFTADTPEEMDLLRQRMDVLGVPMVVARHWAEGSKGAEELAHTVVRLAESGTAQMRFVYQDEDSLWEKMKAIAVQVYGASDISADASVRAKIANLQDNGFGHYPVCVAKTQYSFSTDATLRAAPFLPSHTRHVAFTFGCCIARGCKGCATHRLQEGLSLVFGFVLRRSGRLSSVLGSTARSSGS
jgi:formate--tetrahydrofolate ligase